MRLLFLGSGVKCNQVEMPVFFILWEIASYKMKNPPGGCALAQDEIRRKRPRSARECAKAHSFFHGKVG